MAADPKSAVESALRAALEKVAPEHAGAPILVERPKQAGHGDFSTNIALQLAKQLKRNPRELAAQIAAAVVGNFDPPEIAGPGFINFRLRADTRLSVIARVLEHRNRRPGERQCRLRHTVTDIRCGKG